MALFEPISRLSVSESTPSDLPDAGVVSDGESGALGTYEGTRARQLATWAAATPTARLRWLERAIRFATACGALPKAR